MSFPSDSDFADTKLISWFPKINHGGRLDPGQTASHNQNRDKDIRGIRPFDGHLNSRFLTRDLLHPGFYHPFPLHCDESNSAPKWHPDLESCFLAGFIPFFLWEKI